jgi:hypothetical protein
MPNIPCRQAGKPHHCSELRSSTPAAIRTNTAPPRGATMARLTLQEKIDTVTRLHTVHESPGEVDPDVIQLQHDVDELLARGLWLLSTEANGP